MRKSKKLESLNQTDAMETNQERKTEPTTMDQIWGDSGMGKYNTLDESVYEQELLAMAKVDIQDHAKKKGLTPIDNIVVLRSRLLREFRRHVGAYNKPVEKKDDQKISKEALRILSEGK